jgi:hypothetical protein
VRDGWTDGRDGCKKQEQAQGKAEPVFHPVSVGADFREVKCEGLTGFGFFFGFHVFSPFLFLFQKWVPEIRISGLLSWKNRGNCPRFYFFEKYFFQEKKRQKKDRE